MWIKRLPRARCRAACLLVTVTLLCIPAVPSLRAARSMAQARTARAGHDLPGEVAALDRVLLEAPPFLRGLRRAAVDRLAVIAGGEGAAASYAALSLTSATTGARRAAWQRRAMQLAAAGSAGDAPSRPLIARDTRPPSPVVSAVSTAALVGWILTAMILLISPGPPRRATAAAAALLWLVWLLTLAAA